MVTATENLWGTLPDQKDKIRTPRHILREQAQILSDAYNHLIVGEVTSNTLEEKITDSLYIVAPALNNYRVLIARARHGYTAYPATLEDPFKILRSHTDYRPPAETKTRHGFVRCESESDFREALSHILGSETVHSVIQSLYSQVEQD
jgi:hypothetical protein